jgi:hypothetical protein
VPITLQQKLGERLAVFDGDGKTGQGQRSLSFEMRLYVTEARRDHSSGHTRLLARTA